MDLGFFLGGGAPLTNGVIDWWAEQILNASRKKASSQGGGAHPLHPPPRSAPECSLFKMAYLLSAGLPGWLMF